MGALEIPRWLRTALIVILSIMWISMTTYHYFMPSSPDVPKELNIAFMGLVGYLTAGYKKNEDMAPPRKAPSKRKGK